MKLKPGDRVVHFQGGYMMTVGTLDGNEAECVWFDTSMRYHLRKFDRSTLLVVEIKNAPQELRPLYGAVHFKALRSSPERSSRHS